MNWKNLIRIVLSVLVIITDSIALGIMVYLRSQSWGSSSLESFVLTANFLVLAFALWKFLTDIFLPRNKIHAIIFTWLFALVDGLMLATAAVVLDNMDSRRLSQRALDAFLWTTGIVVFVMLIYEGLLIPKNGKKDDENPFDDRNETYSEPSRAAGEEPLQDFQPEEYKSLHQLPPRTMS